MKKKYIKRANKVLSPVLGKYFSEFEIERAKGCYLYGTDGKKYLDFSAGIAVCNTGHSHPKVVAAAKKQLEKLIHICIGIACYEPYVKLSEELGKLVPIKNAQFFFCQSGSEATEAAIKLAKYATKRSGIIALKGAFHGRTYGALSMTTSKMKYRDGYEPLVPNIYIAEENLAEIEQIIKTKKIAAVIIELILGEGGYAIRSKSFVKGLRSLCTKHNVLLIVDEVQSGIARTGKWFLSQHYGLTPDIICLAKGLASGFPLGGIAASAKLMAKWSPGSHGGTFGGNPVCCAAAIATIETIKKEKLVQKATKLGNYLQTQLKKLQKKYPVIKAVRGFGLMIGVDIGDWDTVSKIMNHCLENQLVIIPTGGGGTVIRFIPPLTITKKQLDQGLKIFEQALEKI